MYELPLYFYIVFFMLFAFELKKVFQKRRKWYIGHWGRWYVHQHRKEVVPKVTEWKIWYRRWREREWDHPKKFQIRIWSSCWAKILAKLKRNLLLHQEDISVRLNKLGKIEKEGAGFRTCKGSRPVVTLPDHTQRRRPVAFRFVGLESFAIPGAFLLEIYRNKWGASFFTA